MRAKAFAAIAALTLAAPAGAIDFKLGRVAHRPVAADSNVTIRLTTLGAPPAEAVLSDANRWTIAVKGPKNLRFAAMPAKPVAYDPLTSVVTLTISRGQFGAVDPSKCSWRVAFQGEEGNRLEAVQDAAISDDFKLGSASGTVSRAEVRVRVRASGIPPSGSIVNNAEYWRVQVSDTSGHKKAIQPVGRAQYSFNSGFVTLTFPATEMEPIQAPEAKWSAAFLGPDTTLVSLRSIDDDDPLHGAKSRDDADLYLSGSYIAGVGTKPLWLIDAKAGYSDAPERLPVLRSFVKSSPANLRFGIYGEMKTNVAQQTPVDRTQLDPDSILGYATLFQTIRLPQNPFLYGLKWEAQPVGGEFSRRYTASNIISGGRVRFIRVLAAEKRWGADLIPSLGFEGGKNLNKPGVLFNRIVDLRGYNAIARLHTGADANFYLYRRVPTPADAYAFTLNGSWVARVPFTAEPFTTLEYLADPAAATTTRQLVVAMRKNTRHYVQVDAAWNLTKLFGLHVEYKYGALPPLFEFASHEVSVGLLFKATYKQNHSVTNPLP